MSCSEFVNKYANAHDNEKEKVLDEAIECLDVEEAKRTQALYDFIDDFVKSQEYLDYIEDKRKVLKRTAATQCDVNDIIIEYRRKEAVEKYPLTEERKKMYAFKRHFEKYAEKQRIEQVIRKQEHGIQVIKAKIHEARRIFECTWETKQNEKEETEEFLMQKYSTKFCIDLKPLSQNARLKLLDKFKGCHHALTARKKKRQENVCKIIEKLVSEYKLKKELISDQYKPFKYRFKPTERVIEDMEVVGTKIELIDREKLLKPVEAAPEKIEEDILPKSDSKVVKKKRSETEKTKKEKKEKALGKKEKKPGNKKVAKEKKTKEKAVKTDDKLILPDFPIINPREKILPEHIDRMIDVIEEFLDFDDAMQNRDMSHVQRDYALGDAGLVCKPEIVLFQNFTETKSYYKTISICNVTSQTRKLRFVKFMFPDEYDHVVFDVEDFGIRKLYAGGSVKIYVNFQPYDTFKSYSGKMIFLSYDVRVCRYYQLEVGIKCVPKFSDLIICPETVNFGCIPIWRADNYRHFKVIKFQNKGATACTIYIRKIFEPLDDDLDEENKENIVPVPQNSTTTLQDISDVLEECLKNIDANFQFECSFFVLRQSEERRIKVFFKNASYVGHYFEKYMVDVYEYFGRSALETAGCQTISLQLETIGHFLTTSPETLDFGTCLIQSCYQLSFEICNGSNSSQAISVRVPSRLVDVVHTDVSMVYMAPRSKRTVFLKLCPSNMVIQESCTYFDKSLSILEFPIHLCVVSKIANDYPPVKVYAYAVLANFEDLTITCYSTKALSNFLSTVLIDMGDCSIYETIWTEISLTNNTDVTQVCGFLDLPQAVTLMPHFGFCKLYPGQRKKFKLYLSPEIKDFPSFPIGSLRNSNWFFKVKVGTITGTGQLTKGIDTKKLKSSLDLMLKQLTMQDDRFASMMSFVEDIKEHFDFNPTTASMINKEGQPMSRVCSLIPSKTSGRPSSIESVDTVLNFQNFLIVETNSRMEIWCKVNLKRPLLEFSHQTVNFPDAPCGSYSLMEVGLQALERDMDKPCLKTSAWEYKAYFQISGGSDEIRVDPCCGMLEKGEASIGPAADYRTGA